MTAHNQFLRKAQLLVGKDKAAIDLSQMQFTFSVSHADKENPQAATVRVYNLSTATLLQIQANEFDRLILTAGYQPPGAWGVIFDGTIVQARIGRESAVDTYAEFLAATGYLANQQPVNQTLAAGSTMADVANASAGAMGVNLQTYQFDKGFKLPRGRVLYGMARDALHEACARAGQSYFYDRENNTVRTLPLQGFRPGTVAEVNAGTGMIGWPTQTQAGVEVRTLLNPAFELGGRIRLNNASVQLAPYSASNQAQAQNGLAPGLDPNGVYRIYTIDHLGNTRGQEWYTSIIALALDESAGGISSLIQAGIG